MPMKVPSPTDQLGKGSKRNKKPVQLSDFRQTNAKEFREAVSKASNLDTSDPVSGFQVSYVYDLFSKHKEKGIDRKKLRETITVKQSNQSDTVIFEVGYAANDDKGVYCQHLNLGLQVWLESYTGIGQDKNRPVSQDNPARRCPFPPSSDDMALYHNKVVGARLSRRATKKPEVESASNRGFRVGSDGRYSSCGVDGWYGARPPTLLQLLTQEYKKGFSFTRAANRQTSIDNSRMLPSSFKESIAKINPLNNDMKSVEPPASTENIGQTASTLVDDSQDYQFWLWTSSRMNNNISRTKPLHETSIVRERQAFKICQNSRYRSWLWENDKHNPHIDYGIEYTTDSELGFEVYQRHSYFGRKAAEFAPASRFGRNKSIFKDLQWDLHLSNYSKYAKCMWTLEEMLGESLKLWGEGYDLCLFPGIGFHNELLLPSVPTEYVESAHDEPVVTVDVIEEPVQEKSETNFKRDYVEPSDHRVDNVCNFFLQKGWKNLPNMLVVVPEALDASTSTLEVSDIVIPSLQEIDKMSRLKHG